MDKRVGISFSPFIVVAAWLTFSVALATWWVIFAYRLLDGMMSNNTFSPEVLIRKQKMLTYEGISLIVLLLAGGIALSYYVWREYRRNRQIKEFFVSFSHELRTPIASLRLQAESLSEDLRGSGREKLAERLVADTVRLELGLENSMFLANIEEMGKLHFENIDLEELLRALSQSWPELRIKSDRSAELRADRRALEAVFKNIINNSVVHGKASEVKVAVTDNGGGKLSLLFTDNGDGFKGAHEKLGELFHRHTTNSGTGMGLFLVESLTRRMQGLAQFQIKEQNKFVVDIHLGGKLR